MFATALLLMVAWDSLQWHYEHDLALNIYKAWMITNGKAPYHDFFDMNTPGNYMLLAMAGRLFGWSDLTFRLLDMLILLFISTCTYILMKPTGKHGALLAAGYFPLWYLSCGPNLSLQREFIAMAPISAMIALVTWLKSENLILKSFGIGLLAGCATIIKPQNIIFMFPVSIPFLVQSNAGYKSTMKYVAYSATGFVVPLILTTIYLASVGGLIDFIDIARNYWPLYTHMNGVHIPVSGLNRTIYLIKSSGLGLMHFKFIMALTGLLITGYKSNQTRDILTLIALLATSAAYPSVAGKFWTYHWLPFHYFCICCASLVANAFPLKIASTRTQVAAIGLCLMIFHTSARISYSMANSWQLGLSYKANPEPDYGIPVKASQFLLKNMNINDTVQPLDWVGGAAHSMLLAKAPLSTRFLFDFCFYHHISTPYIQGLRKQFMEQLSTRKPRFILEITKYKLRPKGHDTTTEFKELTDHLKNHYQPVFSDETFTIFERNP